MPPGWAALLLLCRAAPNVVCSPPKSCKLVFLLKIPTAFNEHHIFISVSLLFVASDAGLPFVVEI
jgi:hypothetical protein